MSFNFTVVARSDGRGGIKPFGVYGAKQAGAKVTIGDKEYKVTSDGRVNIPKAIMDKYGIENSEGLKVVNIRFATRPGKDNWKNVIAEIKTPTEDNKDKKTGEIAVKQRIGKDRNELEPKDSSDINWNSD